MTVVLWVAATMLAIAALLALIRAVRGPSALDRAVAIDVLLSCLIGAIGLEAAYGRHGTTIPVLAVLALLGFVGSVAIARFGAGLGDDDPGGPEDLRAAVAVAERAARVAEQAAAHPSASSDASDASPAGPGSPAAASDAPSRGSAPVPPEEGER